MSFRKRFAFWLPAGLAAVLLSAGIVSSVIHRRQAAVERIEALGGRVVRTHGGPEWLRRVMGGRSLGIFERATVVNLSGTPVTDTDLVHLQRLSGLERLNLSGTGITDDGLQHLAGLAELKALDLSGTEVTGEGLEHLRRLTGLEYLYLNDTQLDEADLGRLTTLTRLREVKVGTAGVSGE